MDIENLIDNFSLAYNNFQKEIWKFTNDKERLHGIDRLEDQEQRFCVILEDFLIDLRYCINNNKEENK